MCRTLFPVFLVCYLSHIFLLILLYFPVVRTGYGYIFSCCAYWVWLYIFLLCVLGMVIYFPVVRTGYGYIFSCCAYWVWLYIFLLCVLGMVIYFPVVRTGYGYIFFIGPVAL